MFKVGDRVKVIIPDPKLIKLIGFFDIYKQMYSPAMGITHQIESTEIDAMGSWAVLKPGSPGIRFSQDWLQLISSSVNSCQCPLRQLMTKGCTCGVFKAEQKVKSHG